MIWENITRIQDYLCHNIKLLGLKRFFSVAKSWNNHLPMMTTSWGRTKRTFAKTEKRLRRGMNGTGGKTWTKIGTERRRSEQRSTIVFREQSRKAMRKGAIWFRVVCKLVGSFLLLLLLLSVVSLFVSSSWCRRIRPAATPITKTGSLKICQTYSESNFEHLGSGW